MAELVVQHAGFRVAQEQAVPGTGNTDVHEPALFFQPVLLIDTPVAGKNIFLHPGDKNMIKFKPLG